MYEILEQYSLYIFILLFGITLYFFVLKIKLKQQLVDSQNKQISLTGEIDLLKEKLAQYQNKTQTLEADLESTQEQLKEAKNPEKILKLKEKITKLEQDYLHHKELLDDTNSFINLEADRVLDFKLGFYERIFPLDSTSDLKIKIRTSQQLQKEIYEEGKAVTIYYGQWRTTRGEYYRHSTPYKEDLKLELEAEHNIMVLSGLEQWTNLQLLLNAFNVSCEKVINSVKYSTLDKAIDKIHLIARRLGSKYIQEYVHVTESTFPLLKYGLIRGVCGDKICSVAVSGEFKPEMGEIKAAWGTDLNLTISDMYIEEKINELKLQYEYVEQKYIESENLKEEKRLAAELKKIQIQAEKEEEQLQAEIQNLQLESSNQNGEELTVLQEKIAELTLKIETIEQEKQRAISMAQQTRTGYVYVISNIGTMGENIVKIGMTRRIDPMERVRELGDASVPFTFDVHAMIRTKDAPKLERELHERFKKHRVNLVNNRKEFFKLSLVDVRDAISEIYSEEFEFNFEVTAFDYNRSSEIREQFLIS